MASNDAERAMLSQPIPEPTPAAVGFRWPAEWEPHAATWLAWPHNPETWPGRLDRAVRGMVGIVRALQGREHVHVAVSGRAAEDAARAVLARQGVDPDVGIDFAHIPTDDAWLRDTGPIFCVRDDAAGRERAAVCFRFDAWGGKYPPWNRDAAVSRGIAEHQGLRRFEADFVLEGGSVDGNGCGTLLTTESCLLHPNREAGRSRELMEARLHDWLGATQVLWLGDGIAGDDTDGHIDDIARFVDAGTVAVAVAHSSSDPNAGVLRENRERLRQMNDQDGRRLAVVDLPAPPTHRVNGEICPASYANFYLANGVVLVPTFGVETDERALATLREVVGDRDVVGVACGDLVQGLGAVHCLSQQEPASRRPESIRS
jgi:agmatine deiminase